MFAGIRKNPVTGIFERVEIPDEGEVVVEAVVPEVEEVKRPEIIKPQRGKPNATLGSRHT